MTTVVRADRNGQWHAAIPVARRRLLRATRPGAQRSASPWLAAAGAAALPIDISVAVPVMASLPSAAPAMRLPCAATGAGAAAAGRSAVRDRHRDQAMHKIAVIDHSDSFSSGTSFGSISIGR